MTVKVPTESLINRLGINMELGVYENLQVTKDPNIAKVNVRVKPEYFRSNRTQAKAALTTILDKARSEGLDAHYEPRGRWVEIGPKLSK